MMLTCWFVCVPLAALLCTVNSEQTCHQACTCLADKRFGGVQFDCSSRKLTAIPEAVPHNTTTLLLNNNSLVILTELKFKRLNKLRFLDLSHNSIRMIHENAFHGLAKLLVLNLSGNSLPLVSSTYKPNVFKPLRELTVLRIEENNEITPTTKENVMYPDECLRVLTSLKELHIDGLPGDFGPGFAKMRNLTTLALTSSKGTFCRLPVLRNTTFVNVPKVQHLDIRHCAINSSELLTFLPLRFKKSIDVSFNYALGFSGVSKATFGLQDSPIEVFKMNHVVHPHHYHHLRIANLYYLQKTKLKELHIDGNNIITVQLGVIPEQSGTLEFVSAKQNNFQYGRYLSQMGSLTLLKQLDLSGTAYRQKALAFRSRTADTLYTRWDAPLFFPPPPNLEVLILRNQYFGSFIERDTDGYLSSIFNNLRNLDVSYHTIVTLSRNIFEGLIRIETIDLSGNYLRHFRVNVSGLKNLSVLILSHNRLRMMSHEVLKELEHVPHVQLQGNPFLCSCESLGFLRWVKRNSYRIQDFKEVTCKFKNVTNMSFLHLDSTIDTLNGECRSENIMAISVSLCLVLFILGAIGIGVGYRHRRKLKYLYHIGRKAYRRHEIDNGDGNNYEYDVFVSYAAPDRRFVIDAIMPELETKAELRMCIHDRDFLPGEVIATNIVNAIQNSRKTLILLSPAFLESHWCEYEYNMARMESVTRRNNIVVVVLYQHVPLSALPKDMAVMLRNNCYLQYNDEEFGSVVFWENVVEAIKTDRLPE